MWKGHVLTSILVFTVCELGEKGETAEKGDLAALVLKKNLAISNFPLYLF